jgi:hypothetical protein
LTNGSTPEENFEEIVGSHAEPIRGGRKRADGVDVQWAVTFPRGEKGGQSSRGRVPFFCHDITPSNVRVPLDEKKTTHPCGAVGVKELTVTVKDQSLLEETKKIHEFSLHRAIPKGDEELRFWAEHVCEVEGLNVGADVVLCLPQNEGEWGRQGFWYGDIVLMSIQVCRDARCNGTLSLPDPRIVPSSFKYRRVPCASILQL